MEHNYLKKLLHNNNINVSNDKIQKFNEYASMVFHSGKNFNLTGNKNIESICENLIIESIEPFHQLNVPRGTLFADIGSGAGIPGIPVGIIFNQMKGLLIESNNKKVNFIQSVINKLELNNLKVICERIEDVGRDTAYRESFDIVFSRALSNPYIVLELGSPLLTVNGVLYIYSNDTSEITGETILTRVNSMGLEQVSGKNCGKYNFPSQGFVFNKICKIDSKYPRNYSKIKKEFLRKNVD